MAEEKLNSQLHQKKSDVYFLEYQKVSQSLGDLRAECKAKKMDLENIVGKGKDLGDRILSKTEELMR